MKLIGITGLARSGKDSLCSAIQEIWGPEWKRYSLADEIKDHLYDVIKTRFNISVYTNNTEEKNIIRPILVAYGQAGRELSEGRYWWYELDRSINLNGDNFVIVTDMRYADPKYHDEYNWLRDNNGVLIHIEREGIKPPNAEEEYFDPIMKELSDFKFSWPTIHDTRHRTDWVRNEFDLEAVEKKLICHEQ